MQSKKQFCFLPERIKVWPSYMGACNPTKSMRGRRAVSQLLKIQRKDVVMFHSSRLPRVGLIAICIIAIALGFTYWLWTFTTSRITSARSIGVFPSPSEGMLTLVHSGWVDIQEARIVHVQQETFLGGGPHVWYVIACVWAESRADGSPVGSATHDFDAPGSYFVNTHEGWILMPESSLPLFVGFWMPVFNLAGDDRVQPFHDPASEPKRICIR
jgi:hypothetical protein